MDHLLDAVLLLPHFRGEVMMKKYCLLAFFSVNVFANGWVDIPSGEGFFTLTIGDKAVFAYSCQNIVKNIKNIDKLVTSGDCEELGSLNSAEQLSQNAKASSKLFKEKRALIQDAPEMMAVEIEAALEDAIVDDKGFARVTIDIGFPLALQLHRSSPFTEALLSGALGGLLVHILTKEIAFMKEVSKNSQEKFEQFLSDGNSEDVFFSNTINKVRLETTKLLFIGVGHQSEQLQ